MAGVILRKISAENESESRNRSGASSTDGLGGQGENTQRFQSGRILRTHRHVREHVIDLRRKPTQAQAEAAVELVGVVKAYLK
jgi:hypothetical protein